MSGISIAVEAPLEVPFTVWASLFGTIAGSTVIASLVTGWFSRTQIRHASARDLTHALLAGLGALRNAYLLYDSDSRRGAINSSNEEERGMGLAALENAVYIAAASIHKSQVLEQTRVYVAQARKFATGDDESTPEVEEKEFFELLDSIAKFERKNR